MVAGRSHGRVTARSQKVQIQSIVTVQRRWDGKIDWMDTFDDAEKDPALERDSYMPMVTLAVRAGTRDPYEYRMGIRDAIQAARWAAAADPTDPRILTLLRTAGELAAAVIASISSTTARQLPIAGELRNVPFGLPPQAITTSMWADCLWAATAVGDAATATRLAHAEVGSFADDIAAGELDLAKAMAGWWRAEPVGPHLVAALQASDPAEARGDERDRRLDIIAPAVAVMRQLLDSDSSALRRAISAAETSFGVYWAHPSRSSQTEGIMSLPLSGLSRLAAEFGLPVKPSLRVVPAALMVGAGAGITLCPVCASPFASSEKTCWWCATEFVLDAALSDSVGGMLSAPSRPCQNCGMVNRAMALRCWNCRASLMAE